VASQTESTEIRWFSGKSGGEAGLPKWWPKATQGGQQAPVHSDQLVLVMARLGGWTA
jgi:hypothetical protein